LNVYLLLSNPYRLSAYSSLTPALTYCLTHFLVGVLAVYNKDDYFEARKAALALWSEKLQEVTSDG
jgi:hypothetical protein